VSVRYLTSNKRAAAVVAVLLSAVSLLVLRASAPHVPSNMWAPTGDMNEARAGASAVLLYNGRVLVTGGMSGAGVSASADRYSPTAQDFVAAPPMLAARANHSSTLLPDGRVIVAGGVDANGHAVS